LKGEIALSAPACLALGAASLAEKRHFHLEIAWFFLPAACLPGFCGRRMHLTRLPAWLVAFLYIRILVN